MLCIALHLVFILCGVIIYIYHQHKMKTIINKVNIALDTTRKSVFFSVVVIGGSRIIRNVLVPMLIFGCIAGLAVKAMGDLTPSSRSGAESMFEAMFYGAFILSLMGCSFWMITISSVLIVLFFVFAIIGSCCHCTYHLCKQ